jgi:hypothetical protein
MASDMVPGFEVKLLLNPSEVLSSDGKLKSDVSAAFNISESTKKMNIQLLDTVEKDINNNGWNLRIRKKESANKFELTYKKRYEVNEEYPATDEEKINAVLNTAKRDGFDSTMPYEVEVELGYQKKTLSISRDEKIPDSGFSELELPKEHKSREVLIEKAPDMFKDWKGQNWGTQLLEKSIIYGPVLAKRSRGIFDGLTLSIEVWSMRKSKEDETLVPIVEASFKTPDLIQALGGRAKLQAFLNDNNWFLPEDSLRTKLIMERYGQTTSCL